MPSAAKPRHTGPARANSGRRCPRRSADLFWDKAQHALAYLVLTGVGLVFFPRRRWTTVFGILAFGVGIEVLQAVMPFGREGDWRDALANTVGALLALTLVQAWRRARR